MKKALIFLSFLLSFCASQAQTYNIKDFGAKGDSSTLNTVAIQKAIDAAATAGGGVVYIPKGKFRSGALFFKPKTSLKIAKGGVLLGSDDIADYPFGPSRMEGQNLMYYAALVNADGVDNFRIFGGGSIDGNGLKFWEAFWQRRKENSDCTNLEVSRPRLIFIQNCKGVRIQNMKLRNAGFWTTHLYMCSTILIEKCDIRSPFKPVKAPSTDALDFDVCKDIIVRNCYLSVNDDAVTIKGGKGPYANTLPENGIVENVLVENCNFGDSHGSVTLGSECIHAKNIVIRNCVSNANAPLLRLKLRPDTPQMYEDITVENCTGFASEIIQMQPWTQFFDLKGCPIPPIATVRNIVFKNLTMKCDNLGIFKSNPNDTVENLRFESCTFTTLKTAELITNHPEAIQYDKVLVNGLVWK